MDIDIKTWAIEGSDRFGAVWDFTDFWKRSNTFHAFLRFVDAAEQRWGNDPALQQMKELRTTMIEKNEPYFKQNIGQGWVWADDYGWCGISCLAARDYLRSIGNESGANSYLNIAEQCWERMHNTGYDASDDATPVPHGCGNVSPDRKPVEGYGTKNTVTNVNLLLLSLRLFAATRKIKYLSMADAQCQWFSSWFADNYHSLDDGYYLRGLPGPFGLIHERPLAEKSYTKQDDPTWICGWVWTGDQGLMLMALAEVLSMQDDFDKEQLRGFDPAGFGGAFTVISIGIQNLLFGRTDKVLREPPFKSSFCDDPGDYVCGRGVLLRYVSEQAVWKMLGNTFFTECIKATAAAVWNSRDPQTNQFASLWNKTGDKAFNQSFVDAWGSGDPTISSWGSSADDGVLQANGLDALTAAIRAD